MAIIIKKSSNNYCHFVFFSKKYQNDCYFHGSKGIFAVETLDETDIRLLQLLVQCQTHFQGTFSVPQFVSFSHLRTHP